MITKTLEYLMVPVMAVGLMLAAVSLAHATGTPPPPPNACIDVTKDCSDAGDPFSPIEFVGDVSNCGQTVLMVSVWDLVNGQIRVEWPDAHRHLAELFELLGDGLLSTKVGRPTLEEAFVHLTGMSFQ